MLFYFFYNFCLCLSIPLVHLCVPGNGRLLKTGGNYAIMSWNLTDRPAAERVQDGPAP